MAPPATLMPPARTTLGHFNGGVERRHVLPASAARAGPLYSSLRQVVRSATMQNNGRIVVPSHNSIRVEIVTTYEQLLHAYAIRSICFIEENGMKAQQMFDGNDYQATHVIVYSGDEPIGALRIRWFKDFAKFERTAFRKAYRDNHALKALARFSFDHVARKGYDKIITHALPKHARLWKILFGFKSAEGKKPVYFDGIDEPCIELVKELTPPLNAISEHTDATVLFRTEGYWDAPSEFEVAAA
jgi:hypothetical protein